MTSLIYKGEIFTIEAVELDSGQVPAEEWLDSIDQKSQVKFAALFKQLGDIGKIWNEQKFKHLEGSDQIFEFKVDNGRILCFFFVGQRVILTHGFVKKSAKTPKGEITRGEKIKALFLERTKTK